MALTKIKGTGITPGTITAELFEANVSTGGGTSVTVYANVASFSGSNSTGDFAFAEDTKALYIWDGSEWDRVYSGPNEAPDWITEPNASYVMSGTGNGVVISTEAIDPEGFPITYSYDTNPANTTKASITNNNDGTFNIVPAGNTSQAGSFSFRVKATDGVSYSSRTSNITITYEFTMSEILLVAGGGGGNGGGGGAGGLVYYGANSTPKTPNGSSQIFKYGQTYTVTVGAGGAGTGPLGWGGAPGANTSITGTGISLITAVGGGGGAAGVYANGSNNASGFLGGAGGSGGGGGNNNNVATSSTPYGGAGVTGQGNRGGDGYATSGSPAGAGGGAGAAGASYSTKIGGVGLVYDISGSATYYAGGGGGGSYNVGEGAGGAGGGGNGFTHGTYNSATDDGEANTGGGGGGGSGATSVGGSGVVIMRAPNTVSALTTGSALMTTSGSDNIWTFTGSGTIVFDIA